MARVNITVPDELLARARAAELNISRTAALALSEELERRAKVHALDAYLRELDTNLGPIPVEEQDAAARWVDRVLTEAEEAGDDARARVRAS